MWGIRRSTGANTTFAKAAVRRVSVPQALLARRHFLLGSALIAQQLPIAAAQLAGDALSVERWTLAFRYTPAVAGESASAAAEERQVSVPVTARFTPSLPAPGPKRPTVTFTPGFLAAADAYGVYVEALLAAGFLVVSYDTTFETLAAPVDDNDSVRLLQDVRRSLRERLGGAAAGPCFLAGHSRGAKLAVLAAAAPAAGEPGGLVPPPLAGLCLLDPANGAFEDQDPARYPSAVGALRGAPQLAGLPVLVVGAGRGGDCVPRAKNFRTFFDACRGPSAMVTLPDAGHMQFQDPGSSSLQLLCAAGRGVRNEDVSRASAALTVAFVSSVGALPCSGHPRPAAIPGGAPADAAGGGDVSSGRCQAGIAGPPAESYDSACRRAMAGSPLRYTLQVQGL